MRITGLDVLRGIAIILVLFRHGNLENNPISHFGWLGVDLFFVISGFLVSGLLFKEYLNSGKINAKRFLIRRGFKIYPAFYFFMIFSLCFKYFQVGAWYPLKNILAETFFIQNYFAGIWSHTWSLAVEEHFYFALALFAFAAAMTNILSYKKTVIPMLILLLLTSFLLRLYISWPHRNDETFTFIKTHQRADGLIIGVLISYLFYFTDFFKSFDKNKKLLLIIAAILIFPGFIFDGGSFIMNTIGLTVVNLGFGIFTYLSLGFSLPPNRLVKAPLQLISFIGKNSYSIYLWHLAAMDLAGFIFSKNNEIHFLLFFLLSIGLGTLLSYAIEKPFLRWREKIIR